jgi:hypothetical protein
MKASGRWVSKGLLVGAVIAVVGVLMLSMMVTTTSAVGAAPLGSTSPAAAVAAASTTAAAPTAANHPSAPSAPTAAQKFYTTPAVGGGPHPGTIQGYEIAPQGMTSEDPAVAYDTVSYEPIINVYQTLIAYNGTSTSNFVPELSTCVPGASNGVSSTASVSCQALYGNSLIVSNSQGEPQYYTFPIAKANFYDPATGASWQVYPSDVMFSLARTMSFADLPGPGVLNGWIQTQSMMPIGNPKYDGGIHFPFNNTPVNILDSMLVNDSTYCPATALAAYGCITFNAFGEGTDWPFFLELVGDALGAGVVPCGWFTYESAGIPGWPGTTAAKGDGPCLLPGGATSTSAPAFQNYVSTLAPTAWDSFQELALNHPDVQGNVRFSLVGSGPYYAAAVGATTGYTLQASPAYVQPSGCVGVGGGCEPAPGGYIGKVVITYEASDTEGIQQYVAGQADFAGFSPPETSTILQLQSEGKIGVLKSPTISTFFLPFDLNFSVTAEATIDPDAGQLNVGGSFFASNTVRELLVHAYPYTTNLNTVFSIDGVQFGQNFGGAIPIGMGNYYPNNVTWPYYGGDPCTGSTQSTCNSSTNSAVWWWTQGTNPSSPYYDAQLAACSPGSPCQFPVIGQLGDPSLDDAIANYIAQVEIITNGALKPYSFDLSFPDLVQYSAVPGGNNPMPYYNLGWAPDYPDPTDYMAAMYYANGTYTLGDGTYQTLIAQSQYNAGSCGHTSGSFSDLVYWATLGEIPSTCQGPAYAAMLTWMSTAASLAPGAQRVLIYNEVEHVENELAFYLWYQEALGVGTSAKWINNATINTNVMIGGGGDQTFYLWSYTSAVSNVYFNETGLPSGTPFSVNFAGLNYAGTAGASSGSILIPGQTNGTYVYSWTYVTGYGVSVANGTVTVVAPTTSSTSATFTAFVCSGATCGTVAVSEGGLQSGTTWSAIVKGAGSLSTNTSDPVFTALQPGVYTVYVPLTVGYNTTLPANGVTSATVVAATTTSIHAQFAGLSFTTFPITFQSSGLGGASWSVAMNGYNNTTTSASIVFWEVANTYSFTVSTTAAFTPIAMVGQTTVSGATTILVPFSASPNALTFTETGLATGVAWGMTLVASGSPMAEGFTVPSTTTTVVFNVGAGTWNYSALPLAGWQTTKGSGSSVVSAATGVTIPFTLVTYPVSIYEVGLPAGGAWSVTATFTYPLSSGTGTATASGTGAVLTLNLPNGTATFTTAGPAGYTGTGGSVNVQALPNFAVVVFTPTVFTYAVTFSQTGVPTGAQWSVTVNGVQVNSTAATAPFELQNGSYSYVVAVPSGYTASPAGGSLTVTGATQQVSLTVSAVTTPPTTTSNSGLSTLAYELIGLFVALAVIFLITTLYFASKKPPAANPPQSWQSSDKSTTTTDSTGDSSNPPPT